MDLDRFINEFYHYTIAPLTVIYAILAVLVADGSTPLSAFFLVLSLVGMYLLTRDFRAKRKARQ